MMSPKLNQIVLYPVKSFRGIPSQHAEVENKGLRRDRQYMLTDHSGTFITARTEPHLLRFKTQCIGEHVRIIAPDGQALMVTPRDFSDHPERTEVWGNYFYSHIASIKINRWFSDYLQRDVQLRWHGANITRRIRRFPTLPLSFADSYPVSLINISSFEQIAEKCQYPITLDQFRGNLVVNGLPAFDEDRWKTLQIGNICFDVIKACARCITTTYDPESSLAAEYQEPLSQLNTLRKDSQGNIDFGIYLIPRNYGTVSVGDAVHILECKTAKTYFIAPPKNKDVPLNISRPTDDDTIDIEYQHFRFRGNSQQTLLEQLEQQHIPLPSSCRAGICGRCEVELISGEVIPLTHSAIKTNKKILACSCRPKGSLKIR